MDVQHPHLSPEQQQLQQPDKFIGNPKAGCSIWHTSKSQIRVGHLYSESEQALIQLLAQVETDVGNQNIELLGPIDGTTWFNYRLAQHGQPAFLSEPAQPDFFYSAFEQAGWQVAKSYCSVVVNIDEFAEPKFDQLAAKAKKVSIHSLSGNQLLSRIGELHQFCHAMFANNAYYLPISTQQFAALYQPILQHINPDYCQIIEQDGELKGFVFAFIDGDKLVIKTAALAFGKTLSGLTRYIIANMVARAKKQGVKHIIYALMADDNASAKTALKLGKVSNRYHLLHKVIGNEPI